MSFPIIFTEKMPKVMGCYYRLLSVNMCISTLQHYEIFASNYSVVPAAHWVLKCVDHFMTCRYLLSSDTSNIIVDDA